MLTRRDLIKTAGLGVTVSFLQPALISRAFAASGGGDKVLVILQLAGGNDALNTFIPYADSRYRTLRPTLGIAEASILPVDGQMGLHPALAPLLPLYEQGVFTFVNNVGFATLDRSHFHCQDVWQTGVEGDHAHHAMGWLGRYADLYLRGADSSLTAMAIGSKIPLGMSSEEVLAAVIQNAASYEVLTTSRPATDRNAFIASLRSLYGVPREATAEQVRMNGSDMFESVDLMKTIPPASTTAGYPDSPLGRALQLVAQTIAGNVGTRAAWVTLGGFDTHSGQASVQDNLLTDVASSMKAFQTDLTDRGLAEKVLLLAWSEFGRRAQQNASDGTDHGKAGSVMILGNAVRGRQYYGGLPDLGRLDGGDVRTEVDFRAVYSTVIQSFLGNDPEPVMNGRYENLGFVERVRRRTVRR